VKAGIIIIWLIQHCKSHSIPRSFSKDTKLKPPDLHIHSNFSCDCHASLAEMCQAAVAKGLSAIGFTEHFDLLPADPCYDFLDLPGWWREIESCREQFADQLTIYAGIELGEPHRFISDMREVLDSFPWDFALGSLHWVGDELIFGTEYFRREPDQAYREYFEELGQMASVADFDILAHMDVVKRFGLDVYGEYDVLRYEKEVRAVLKVIAKRGIALEVNTSQLRRRIGETSPARPVIDWFREEGGQWITFGSDAHEPDHVGMGLDLALVDIVAGGFPGIAHFQARQPSY
jgi:histidinol-phosphatase (PHP family)